MWSGYSGTWGSNSIIVKYNSSGTVVWKQLYRAAETGSFSDNSYNEVEKTNDGGFIAVGYLGGSRRLPLISKYTSADSLISADTNTAKSGDYTSVDTQSDGGYAAASNNGLITFNHKSGSVSPIVMDKGTVSVTGGEVFYRGDSFTSGVSLVPQTDSSAAQITVKYPEGVSYSGFSSEYAGVNVSDDPSANQLVITGDFSADPLSAGTEYKLASLDFSVDKNASYGLKSITPDVSAAATFLYSGSDFLTLRAFDNHRFSVINSDTSNIKVKEIFINGIREVHEAANYSASVFPDKASDKTIQWSVSDSALASIDQNGALEPLKNGTVKVRAYNSKNGVSADKEVVISGLSSCVTDISFDIGEYEKAYSAKDKDRTLYVPYGTQGVNMSVSFTGGAAVSSELGIIFNNGTKYIALDSSGRKTVSFTKSESGLDDTVYTITIITLSATPSPTPTVTAPPVIIITPTATPTIEPSESPLIEPSESPSIEPSESPSVEPSASPSIEPSATPSIEATKKPIVLPTLKPIVLPTEEPAVRAERIFEISDVRLYSGAIGFEVKNISDTAADGTVMIAAYDGDGALVSLSTQALTAIAPDEKGGPYLAAVFAASYYRMFVWNSLDTMRPVSDSMEIK